MRTSVNMIRPMGEFKVTQRTKDSMFNATELSKQWNMNTNQRKDTSDFLRLNSTKEFILALESDNTGIPVVLKSSGKNGGTWMHPYLFIDFAMWLNPKFKVKVIKFVYDLLIQYRINTGDMYVGLSKSLSKMSGVDYSKIGKALNYIVFNEHEKGRRNRANEEQLKELYELEKQISFMIDHGWINTFQDVLVSLRSVYNKKYSKFNI